MTLSAAFEKLVISFYFWKILTENLKKAKKR